MRALKILVIVMGVLLVGGFVALVVTVANRLSHRHTHAPEAAQTVILPNNDHRTVDLPVDAKILDATSDGNRVMLRLALPDGDQELILLDWRTGARVATLDLHPSPASR